MCKKDGNFLSFNNLVAQFIAMRSVRTLYTAMMVLLAKANDRELARMVSYLKEENQGPPRSPA